MKDEWKKAAEAMKKLADVLNAIPEDELIDICTMDLAENEVYNTWLWDIHSN